MFIKKLLLLLFITRVLISCDEDDKSVEFNLKFPINKQLTGKGIDKIKQMSPFRIGVIDSIFVVNDWDENPRIHFYNISNFNKITSYATIGSGPFDFSNPEIGFQKFKNNKLNTLIIYELGSGLITEINYDSIFNHKRVIDQLNPNEFAFIRKRFLPPNLVGSDHILKVGNYLIGEAISDKKIKYFKLNFNNFSKIETFGKIYKSDFLNKVSEPYKQYIDRSYLSYSKESKKYIASYFLLNKIEIMDENFNLIKQINYGSEKEPNSVEPFSKLNVNYFGFSFSGKDRFYVMYSGKSSEGLTERREPKEIHVFDYNAKPLARYILDHDILSYTIDETRNKLYIITNNEQTPVFEYNLND